jgi:hypothetical protein
LQNLLSLAQSDPKNVTADLIDDATAIFRDVVNLSAQIKGPTAGFAEDRDAALSIIDEIISLGDAAAKEKFSLEESAAQQVNILSDIREALQGPDPALDLIQAQLDSGIVTNTLLSDLLQQFIDLSRVQFQTFSPSAVQQAATAAVGTQVTVAGPVTIDNLGSVVVSIDQLRKAQAQEQKNTRTILQEIRDNQRAATGSRTASL